jgi:exonuclease SbcC
MMPNSGRLKSISVRDFRSIKGESTISLDAAVILVHGANGAGKTSLLSAIELAATGKIKYLDDVGDTQYQNFLQHRGSVDGFVSLTARGVSENDSTSSVTVSADGISGQPLLSEALALSFAERNFLPQTTLGRLLEVYAPNSGKREDTSLIRFVKELLGLDELDALIDGLDVTHHISRARKSSGRWRAASDSLEKADAELNAQRRAFELADAQLNKAHSSLREKLGNESAAASSDRALTLAKSELASIPTSDSELALLQSLAFRVDAIETTIGSQALNGFSDERFESATSLEGKLDRWWAESGSQWLGSLNRIRLELTGLEPTTQANSFEDFEETISANESQKDATVKSLEQLDLERSILDQSRLQFSGAAAEISSLAAKRELIGAASDTKLLCEAIALMLPFVATSTCPLCDQPFPASSSETLQQHIASKLAGLTKNATDLLAIDQELQVLRAAQAERNSFLSSDRAAGLEMSIAELERASSAAHSRATTLEALRPRFVTGREIRNALLQARRAEVSAGQDAIVRAELTAQLRAIAAEAGEPISDEYLSKSSSFLRQRIEARLSAAAASSSRRKKLNELIDDLAKRVSEHDEVRQRLALARANVSALKRDIKEAERRKDSASALRLEAERVRSDIISRVFNERLNKTWREFFSRLVPAEPFVPQFKKQANRTRVTDVQLQTIHRDGVASASPGAMLSFGNVNTAALSLFLSLHFSSTSGLPWLIFDDPVQSMDDIHVANFAAMVRQLSRTSGRQVLIAVHQRELFDYLALELSPGGPGQELALVTLERTDGDTRIGQSTRHYSVDKALPDFEVA